MSPIKEDNFIALKAEVLEAEVLDYVDLDRGINEISVVT